MEWFSAKEAAKRRDVSTGTMIGHIDDGTLEAVNVARKGSKRRRFKISEAMLSAFDERRATKPVADTPKQSASRRTIARPVKDYFAPQNADESPAAPVITPAQRRRQSEAARQALQEAGV